MRVPLVALVLALLGAGCPAYAETYKCKVQQALQLSDTGNLEPIDRLAAVWRDAFYVDSLSGKVTGGPMSTEGWGEIKVYPIAKDHTFTVLSYTQGTDTRRGLRTLYVAERKASREQPFHIADGLFSYSGVCVAQ